MSVEGSFCELTDSNGIGSEVTWNSITRNGSHSIREKERIKCTRMTRRLRKFARRQVSACSSRIYKKQSDDILHRLRVCSLLAETRRVKASLNEPARRESGVQSRTVASKVAAPWYDGKVSRLFTVTDDSYVRRHPTRCTWHTIALLTSWNANRKSNCKVWCVNIVFLDRKL